MKRYRLYALLYTVCFRGSIAATCPRYGFAAGLAGRLYPICTEADQPALQQSLIDEQITEQPDTGKTGRLVPATGP